MSRIDVFLQKFQESVSFENLIKNRIINYVDDPERIAEYIIINKALSGNGNISYDPTKIPKDELIRNISKYLSQKEKMLICFLAHGFIPDELVVVFNCKHIESIHVMIHRIRKKVCRII